MSYGLITQEELDKLLEDKENLLTQIDAATGDTFNGQRQVYLPSTGGFQFEPAGSEFTDDTEEVKALYADLQILNQELDDKTAQFYSSELKPFTF